MPGLGVRVVKVGGSLFTLSDLGPRLQRWLNQQTPAHDVLLAGGGRWADAIREADARFGLGQQTAHALCVETLRVSARVLAALLPGSPLVIRLPQLRTLLGAESRGSWVFCPYHFLTRWEPRHHPRPLPATWEVTSDSISARLADVLGAGELVLLKSCAPPVEPSAGGYVDQHFAIAAANLARVRQVNFRSAW